MEVEHVFVYFIVSFCLGLGRWDIWWHVGIYFSWGSWWWLLKYEDWTVYLWGVHVWLLLHQLWWLWTSLDIVVGYWPSNWLPLFLQIWSLGNATIWHKDTYIRSASVYESVFSGLYWWGLLFHPSLWMIYLEHKAKATSLTTWQCASLGLYPFRVTTVVWGAL